MMQWEFMTSHSASSIILPESYSLSNSTFATEEIHLHLSFYNQCKQRDKLYYDIVAETGNTPTAADFEGITSLTGNSFSTTNDLTSITLYPKNDGTSNENKHLTKIVDLPGSLGSQLAISNSVTLVDGGQISHSKSSQHL